MERGAAEGVREQRMSEREGMEGTGPGWWWRAVGGERKEEQKKRGEQRETPHDPCRDAR